MARLRRALIGTLKLLDTTYGLYLHWRWERERKGTLLQHLMCGFHLSAWLLLLLYLMWCAGVEEWALLLACLPPIAYARARLK